MVTVLINRGRVEGSQTIDEARLVDDLRSPLVLSWFVGVGGFDDLWGVEEGSGGTASRCREAVAFGRGRGVYRCGGGGRSGGFTRGTKAKRKRTSGST